VINQLQALSAAARQPDRAAGLVGHGAGKASVGCRCTDAPLPYVQNAEAAEQAVSYTRYPPHGVRGVSGSSRAASYGLVTDYVVRAGG